jgi:hypothetical protein
MLKHGMLRGARQARGTVWLQGAGIGPPSLQGADEDAPRAPWGARGEEGTAAPGGVRPRARIPETRCKLCSHVSRLARPTRPIARPQRAGGSRPSQPRAGEARCGGLERAACPCADPSSAPAMPTLLAVALVRATQHAAACRPLAAAAPRPERSPPHPRQAGAAGHVPPLGTSRPSAPPIRRGGPASGSLCSHRPAPARGAQCGGASEAGRARHRAEFESVGAPRGDCRAPCGASSSPLVAGGRGGLER